MGVLTAKKISDYYERFRSVETTFTKEVMAATGIVAQQIQLKCGSGFFPCFVYSTSFEGVKVIASTKSGLLDALAAGNNLASLKYFFRVPLSGEQAAFFVSVRLANSLPYNGSDDQLVLNFVYNQRPPDDLIEIMGRIVEVNQNFALRRNERILLSVETLRKLGIAKKDSGVFVEGVPRRCLLRELTLGGARIVVAGIAKFLLQKKVRLRLEFTNPVENMLISGQFSASEPVVFRKDIVVMIVTFDEKAVPISYKLRISDYLISAGAEHGEASAEGEAAESPAPPAAPASSAGESEADPSAVLEEQTTKTS